MNIVLFEPEIPPNTGNVARLCAATNTVLHLIEPLGFEITDARLKRAGMDYWKQVQWRTWPNWSAFRRQVAPETRVWVIESDGPTRYCDARFGPDDYLVFGRESTGLPEALLVEYRDTWLRIPMIHPDARSLNLSSCAALVLYESLRQHEFSGERGPRTR